MRAGIGELTSVPPDSVVYNMSSVNDYLLCIKKWHNGAVAKRITPMSPAHYLHTGTVGHDAVQELHELMGTWEPDAALGIAQTAAARVQKEVDEHSNLMTETDRTKREEWVGWIKDALPAYAVKFRSVPWTEMIAVEQALWLCVEREELPMEVRVHLDIWKSPVKRIYFVGRPDALVVIRDKVWHIQRKFFSEGVDLMDFVQRGPFQKHEVFYLTVVQQLYEQGDLAFPAGHTLFDLFRKLARPEHPSEMTAPKMCKCHAAIILADEDEEGQLTLPESSMLHLMQTHKQMSGTRLIEHTIEERAKQDKFTIRKAAKQLSYDTWAERAFVRHECIITRKQRAAVFEDIVSTAVMMTLTAEGCLPVIASEGWGCRAYFRPCPYKGVCSGIESLKGPQFADRPDNYTDVEVSE